MEDRAAARRSRDRILDAAARVVRAVGARRMTLEAVADEAGLSKGGLLYNFPSKNALLQAMLQRLIDSAEAERNAMRPSAPIRRNAEVRLGCEAALRLRAGEMRDVAIALLAASAEDPQLLDPLRRKLTDWWTRLKEESDDPAAAALAWLAVEGLNSLDMHGISPIAPDERARIVESIFALLERGVAREDVVA